MTVKGTALAAKASICIRHQVIDDFGWETGTANSMHLVDVPRSVAFSCHGVVELGQIFPFVEAKSAKF